MSIYNTAQLRCIFREFNEQFFDNCLPMPDFEIMHSFKFFGYFSTDICNNTTVNPVIKISDNYEYTELQLRDVFVHEMIHYYLAYTGRDIVCSHGYEFISMADRFNRIYGTNITETININEYERREGTSWFKYMLCKLF